MGNLGLVISRVRVTMVVAALLAPVLGCDARALDSDSSGSGGSGAPGGSGGSAGAGEGAGGAGGVGPATGAGAGGSGGVPVPVPTVPLPVGVTPAPYVAVQHEAGTCATASAGVSQRTASAAEVASVLVGRWRLCGGAASVLSLPTHAGMELARDRSWRLLVADGDSLVPAKGFDSAGLWYMTAEDPNDMVTHEQSAVRIKPDGAGATGYPVELLQHPTTMRLGHTLTYVWIGE